MSKLKYIGWFIFLGGILNISKYPFESAEWVVSVFFIVLGSILFSYGKKISDYISDNVCKIARSKPAAKGRQTATK